MSENQKECLTNVNKTDFARGFAAAMSEAISYHQREVNHLRKTYEGYTLPSYIASEISLHQQSAASLRGLQATIETCHIADVHVIENQDDFMSDWCYQNDHRKDSTIACVVRDAISQFVSEARLELYFKNLFPSK